MSKAKNTKSKSKSKAQSKPKVPAPRKLCSVCGPSKGDIPRRNFYRSYNLKIHGDGYLPICKNCVADLCFDEEKQDINYEEFKNVLRQIDKPFISSVMHSSIKEYNDTYEGQKVPKDNRSKIVGVYFKNINSLSQYRDMNWMDGLKEEEASRRKLLGDDTSIEEGFEYEYVVPEGENTVFEPEDVGDFVVTKDLVRLFGPGYKPYVYKAMWEKYNFLKQSYPDVTNLHTEALVTYVRFKTQEEIATAKGNADDAKMWSDAAGKAADRAKINPSQLSQSDLQGGLNSFSELLQAVEKAVDIIPILPRFKHRPNDAIDFNIWCLVNYIRDLEGKPLCEYEDVYAFYDKRKAEYVAQYGDPYGIFEGDTTEKNRPAIKRFIDIPKEK